MKRAVHLFVAVLLVSIQAVAAVHATNYAGGNLSDWLVEDAAPALSKTLTQHPRFRNETIVLVDLDEQQLAHSSDGLTLAVLDSLHSSLLQTPGLLISRATGPENCASRIRSGYFLVVQATPVSRNDAKVEIRIFDVVEQQWVSGFGQQWRGRLSKAQWTAMAQQVVPDNALGERIAPFADDQSDLLAARLAAELACQLRHRG
ncbi:MAG: hypothetical protein KJO35_04030, partial [Gammaproteobacteria bacterium]|nr:hypothetical protein [Gammaproteobacteria bacterium]